MSEAAHPSVPDPEGLVARLRAEDPEALAQAYRLVFGGEVGRFVLGHILAEAGMGQRRPRDLGGAARAYEDGRLLTAITIMNRAGFDKHNATVMTLSESNQLEGRPHERSGDDDGRGFGRADDRPGDLLLGD